jgi:predicted outer membrane repeat protein
MHGGAMSNYSGSSPLIRDCDFSGNAASYGGSINNYADCSPTIAGCVLNGNYVTIYGGAISNYDHSDCVLINCAITENWAHSGAGIYNLNSNPRLYGCVLGANRSAEYGTALYSQFSDSTFSMINCTFAGNRSDSDGAAVWNDASSPVMANCIFWNNQNTGGAGQSAQIYTEHGSPAISYCCIQGWTGQGGGNFEADPLFVDAVGPDGKPGTLDDDLRLEAGSRCIDAGDNTSVPADIADLDNDADTAERMPLDLEGRNRFVDYPEAADTGLADLPDYPKIVDLGAYEHRFPLLVDVNAQGQVSDGSGWDSAYRNLQDALAAASGGDQIWMAGGIYRPDVNSAEPDGSGNRQATFELIEAVSIRGGYGGYGADDPNSRDTAAFVTILSGDLLGNDGELAGAVDLSTDPNRVDNCFHVVTARLTGPRAVLDGVVVTGGYADAAAGEPGSLGGGIYNESAGCTIRNCVLEWNLARYGGGMYNIAGSAVVEGCAFRENFAYESGGAMRNNIGDRTSAAGCTFRSNHCLVYGGAIANSEGSDPVLTDCDFLSNTAGFGGAVHNYNNSDPEMAGCTFSDNRAGGTGGALRFYECGEPAIGGCDFSGNTADYGGAVYNFAGGPVFSDCGFYSNSSATGGGAVCDSGGGLRATGCLFSGNQSDNDGGALYVSASGGPVFDRCVFRGNTAVYDGGVMYNASSSSPSMSNCLLAGNSAYSGGAISNKSAGMALLVNCTMALNSAVGAGGIFNDGGDCSLVNCIVWDNINSTQIFPPGSADISYSCVQNYSGAGIGNTAEAPLFVDPNGPDGTAGTEDDDFRIGAGSPCVDTADNASVPVGVTVDLEGRPRMVDAGCGGSPVVDMGAYEFSYAYRGDLDGQCDVDLADLAVLARSWMRASGDEGYRRTSDIAPWPADGEVDGLDLKVITENWLFGLD